MTQGQYVRHLIHFVRRYCSTVYTVKSEDALIQTASKLRVEFKATLYVNIWDKMLNYVPWLLN
jgi:hypothetical protein